MLKNLLKSVMKHHQHCVPSRVLLGCILLGVGGLLWSSSALAAVGTPAEIGGNFKLAMPKTPNLNDPNSPIDVTADRMTADKDNNLLILDGNVEITFSDIVMTCDYATYNHETCDVHAEGNVIVESESAGSWRGESIDFNHKTGEGLVGTGVLRYDTFTMVADSMVRDDDNVLHAKDAHITTCKNEEECDWHWHLTGDGECKEGEFIELSNAVFHLWNLPVMWMPYYYRDFNTHYGIRFMPGYSGEWGPFLLTAYLYPIYGARESDARISAKTALDYRYRYGVGIGQEFTWRDDTMGNTDFSHWGRITGYYARHYQDPESTSLLQEDEFGHNRWSLGLTEFMTLSPRDTFSIEGEATSDSQFRSDYDEISVRASSQSVTVANYEHREDDWIFSLSAAGPIESFTKGVRRLPEAKFDLLPKNNFLGLNKLVYESQNTVGWLVRQPSKIKKWVDHERQVAWTDGNWQNYESARFDTRHMIRRPFEITNGVTFTPRMGWRGTFYSDAPNGDNLFRSLPEIGATLQARIWRDYQTKRHTIVPYMDFTYVIADQDAIDEVPYAFDRIDGSYEWRDRFGTPGTSPTHRYKGLRTGLRNLWQDFTESKTGRTYSDWLNLDLYSIYVMETQDHWVMYRHRANKNPNRPPHKYATRAEEKTGLRVLGFSSEFMPCKAFAIDFDAEYDPKLSQWATFNVNGKLKVDTFTLYLGFLHRNHDLHSYYWEDMIEDEIIYGGLIHNPFDLIEWSAYWRYNTKLSRLEEVGGYVQYNIDCLSFRLNIGHLPSYYSEDYYNPNARRHYKSDVRFSLGIWLRALPRAQKEPWMNWGSFATLE